MVEESALFKKHRLKAIECKLRSSKEIIGHKKIEKQVAAGSLISEYTDLFN
jgi:hypothetical protein